MTLPAFISQPEKYRTEGEAPEWYYFPSLRTLLGLGPGIDEEFRDGSFFGVRNVFFLGASLENVQPAPLCLLEQYHRFYQIKTHVRQHMPMLVIDGTNGEKLFHLTETTDSYELMAATRPKPRTLIARRDYAVGTERHIDGTPRFVLYRRDRRLKPAWADKLKNETFDSFTDRVGVFLRSNLVEREKELRLLFAEHLAHQGNRAKRHDPVEQHLIRQRAETTVLKELGLQEPQRSPQRGSECSIKPDRQREPAPPSAEHIRCLSRPETPLPEAIRSNMAKIARRRINEIVRGEHEWVYGQFRRLKRPFSEFELLERAIHMEARRDAAAMLYDFELVPIAVFSHCGLNPVTSQAPVPTTPSVNP